MKFKYLDLGFADSELEYNRKPEIFDNAFYDPKGYIEKLVDFSNPKSILIGRKGVGKTAYSAKIRRDFANHLKGKSIRIDLSSIPYVSFSKISNIKTDVEGAQRHLHSWNILLIFEILSNVDVHYISGDSHNFKLLKNLYKELGFSSDLTQNVLLASKKQFKVNFFNQEIILNHEPNKRGEKVLFTNIIDMSKYVDRLFQTLKIEVPLILMIDGVDDILRVKKQTKDILAGLVRCTFNLNENCYKNNNNVKILLMIRDDIIKTINDPDFNKIIQDTSYKLDWYDKDGKSDLLHLLNLRFKLSPQLKSVDINYDPLTIWNQFFPAFIDQKSSSWDYFLEYTMYRPRDVIQFVARISEDYPNLEKVQINEFKDELKKYSQNYFIGEMNNELSGFISDEMIQELPGILQDLGKSSFSFSEFSKAIDNSGKENVNTKYILSVLFDLGYIGMLRNVKNKYDSKTYVNFKHKDPRLKLDLTNRLLIHKGLFYALNV
ncbi:P-loop ATPase, Sll1717 family [Enterococcus faecalis]|jgi:hypothetical protein|uniref:P-loop ATPase, Sll1717 family n=1 Tax=Enterococcus faecalis TaxID=1351 RepID=UPI00032E42FF|nr:hypothetical protein [Enterococcus faecalis]EGO5030202.1 hypothetical protein [Enterococcus faecalis]EJC3754593.1 hypothetical protein [Enterococcus faecalis]EOE09565.1 hypothetical protein Q9Q_01055 [Enterococcus faecalis EnGen0078]EOK34598.1 hypothetical protein WU9_00455 [Enterococcus faecalis EnGen0334]KII50415.1 hypothetical protein QH72_01830 [Enterococcus faecalis]